MTVASMLFALSLSGATVPTLGIAALLALGGVLGLFYQLGWLSGRRRLDRIVCQSDGRWLLCEAGGRTYECKLSGSSRITTHLAWLRWEGRPTRPLLLILGDVADSEFRRLIVRLRLHTDTPDESADAL